jgi:murein DD-endopeptidase MepM/ murein hydrolase activator NlpD
MRGVFAAAAVALALVTVAHAHAPAPPLLCAGAFAQGGVIVCKTEPGASVTISGPAGGGAASAVADGGGYVVLGLDRDAGANATVAATGPLGGSTTQDFAIAQRRFSIQRIDGLPEQTVTPTDPAVLAKIKDDTAKKSAAFARKASVTGFLDGFLWPVSGRMTSAWGNQRVLNGVPKTPHYGIDIAAPGGTAIRAPAGGVVTLAEPSMHFEGGLVFIDHGQGLQTLYLHLSRLDVKKGAILTRGQTIGAVGRTGRATGNHLCWRMKWRDHQLDPSLAIQGLAIARAQFVGGPAISAGAPPAGFVPWSAPAP